MRVECSGRMEMLNLLKSDPDLWRLFTKAEEYAPRTLDRYQRFPYSFSRHRSVLRPWVSEFLVHKGLRVQLPYERRFAVCLTHDIDIVYFSLLMSALEALRALREGRVSKSMKILLGRAIKRLNPLWNFSTIMSMEEKYGAKSTFYLLSLKPSDLEFNYLVGDLTHEVSTIIDKGGEIGLHVGPDAWNDLNAIAEQKASLEKVVGKRLVGCRIHRLKFEVPMTWGLLQRAGFSYDATFGYADCAGFRNGMCHPFKPFNLQTGMPIDILEVPLNVADYILDWRMQLDPAGAWDITRQLIDAVEKCRGILTILWHNNTYMIDDKSRLYEKILKYCHEKKAWMTSGEDIWKWWEKQGYS